MGVHHLLAENHRQELVEGDVLDQGGVDVPGLLFDDIDNHKNYNGEGGGRGLYTRVFPPNLS